MELKVVLWHRASGNLYFEFEPQRNSKLRYGIGLVAIYDLKLSLNGTQSVNKLMCFRAYQISHKLIEPGS